MSDDPYEDLVVKSFLQHAPPILQSKFKPDCCIIAAKVGREVLAHYGIDAWPVSAIARVFNQVAQEIVKKEGGMILNDDPRVQDFLDAGYWLLWIGKQGGDWKPVAPGKWDGHLVLVTTHQIIDTTLGFHSRPDKMIELRPASFELPPEFRRTSIGRDKRASNQEIIAGYDLPGGAKVIYHFLPGDTSYKKSPNWVNAELAKTVAATIINEMNKHVPRKGG